MNSKNIKKHLNAKVSDWLKTIDDDSVKAAIKKDLIITGGALVSLLTGEQPHDYDCYFRTKETCAKVALYYVNKWNQLHPDGKCASLVVEDDKTETIPGRVKVFIQSAGVVEEEKPEDNVTDLPFPPVDKPDEETALEKDAAEGTDEKPKYRPVFLSTNAITLSDKIQLVTRFYGEVGEIHKNYDFAHCTCSWDYHNNELNLPTQALECIINKELYYVGSKYPLCSIIRTRKYLERGYHINAGQYIKMGFQLSELDLSDVNVLEEQLTGVDMTYCSMLIDALKAKSEERVNKNYLFELINRMF